LAKLREIRRRIEVALLIAIGAVILIVLFVSALYWITPIQRWTIQRVLAVTGAPVHLDFDKLRFGIDFIRADNLLLYVHTEDKGFLIRADSLRARFEFKCRLVHNLEIYRPRVSIGDMEGPKSSREHVGGFNLPDFQIDTLFITDGEMDAGNFSLRELFCKGSFTSAGKSISFYPDSLEVFLPHRGVINNAVGKVVLNSGIVIELDLVLNRSELSVEGVIESFDPLAWRFKAGGEKIDLAEVDSLLSLGFLIGDGHAEIDLSGTKDTVAGDVFIDGSIYNIQAGNTSTYLHFKNRKLRLSSLKGMLWGAPVDATLEMSFPKEKGAGHIDMVIDGYIGNLDLNSFLPDGGVPSNISGRAHVVGKIVDKLVFMAIRGDLGPGSIFGINFDAATGSVYVAPDSILFFPGFEVLRGGNLLTMNGIIVYKGEIYIEFGVWAPNISKLADIVGLEEVIGGRARLENSEILGSVKEPILSIEIVSDSLVTSFVEHSSFHGEATIYNLIDAPRGNVYIESEGAFGELTYDSLLTNIEICGNRYYIKPFLCWGDKLSAKGIAEIYASPESTGICAEGLELVFLGKPVSLESTFTVGIVGDTIRSTDLFIGTLGGLIEIKNLQGDKDNLTLNADFENLQLAHLAEFIPVESISGHLSGDLFLTMPYDYAGAHGSYYIRFDDTEINGLQWQRAEAEGSIHDGIVDVQPLVIDRESEKYTLRGWIDPNSDSLPFSFEINGRGERFDAFSSFVEEVDSAIGPFDFTLSIAGTSDSLFAEGKLDWRQGILGLKSLADPVESLSLGLSLVGNWIVIDTFGGTIGALPVESKSLWARVKRIFTRQKKEYGDFSAMGDIDISNPAEPELDITFKTNNLPLNFPENGIFTRADADLAITGGKPVLISGTVEMDNANIVKLETDGGESGTLPVELNIVLEIPGNVWVLTDMLEAEIKGKINFLTEQKALALYGELKVVRGKAFFYGRTFHIEEGSIYFESIERINPRLDLRAVSKAGNVDIVLNITGNLETPQIALSVRDNSGEIADYDQKDILSLLALNTPVDGRDSLGYENILQERLPQVLQNYITHGVENVARTTLGVETFEFEPSEEDALDLSEANVTIGKYLTDRLYLKYTRSLNFEDSASDVINLEYRLTDHISLDGHRKTSVEDGNEYRLDLKFNWDY